jgi:multiple sugar transport system permease protein
MTSATLAKGAATPASTTRARKARRGRIGLLYVAPFAVSFLLFLAWPTVYGIWMSFTDRDLAAGTDPELVGFANYAEALTDPMVWTTFGNTVLFTVLTTIPLVVLSLVAALLVNLGLPGQWVWRMAFFLPYLLASTVVSLLWEWIYNPELGLLNAVLGLFGFEGGSWLQDPDTAMPAIALTTTWWTLGFNFLLYLAALQGIPATVYEAAALDGAGPMRTFWSVTVPLMRHAIAFFAVVSTLGVSQMFLEPYVLTDGGPYNSSTTTGLYLFRHIGASDLGTGAANTFLLVILVMGLSLAAVRVFRESK